MIFVLFVGLILRLISLNQSLWLDEATSAIVAQMSLAEIFSKFLTGDFHPPLYYLILKYWSVIFGYSEIALRLPSVIFGIGTVYVTHLIGKNLKLKDSMEAALLIATSGLHIYYSQEARMYALAAFFVSLTLLFFVKTLKEGRAGDFILLGIFLTLSVLTDYLPLLIIPTMLLIALIEKKKFDWWKKYIMSHIIPLSFGLVWLPYFLKQLNQGLNVAILSPAWWQILGSVNFKNLILIPTKFIFGRINVDANLQYMTIIGLVFLIFGYQILKSLRDIKKTRIIWLWFLIPLILGTLLSFWIPTLSYFRFLFVLPAFYLLVSYQLNKWLFIILVLFNLTTSLMYLLNSKNHREDWKGLVDYIESEKVENSTTIFIANSNMEAYRYYAPNAKIAGPDGATNEYSQIWLMRYLKDVFDPEDKVKIQIEEMGYKKLSEHDFNGIVVWKYSK